MKTSKKAVVKKEKKQTVKIVKQTIKKQKLSPEIKSSLKDESKRITAILKSLRLQPESGGFGDYKAKREDTDVPVLAIDFKDPKVISNVVEALHKKFGYDCTVKDKIVAVTMIKMSDTKLPQVENVVAENIVQETAVYKGTEVLVAEHSNDSVNEEEVDDNDGLDDAAHYHKLRDINLGKEKDKLEALRKKAQRVVALVKVKFNLNSIRSDKQNGFSSGKVTNPDVTNFRMGFSTSDMTKRVAAYLEEENYKITNINNKELLIDLYSDTESVKIEKHEKKTEMDTLASLINTARETVEKSRTAHLTPEQIGTRIWDFMANNHIFLVDGSKKMNIADFFNGTKISDWDKETFVNLIVMESLR